MKIKELFSGEKHIKLRIALFILFFLIAIGAFALGAFQLTNKEAGYYTISANPSEDAAVYDSNFIFQYYFTGTSNEIKTKTAEVKDCYSAALLRAYKLTDAENKYESYVNLATLNERPGETVELPAELFEILKDAIARSESEKGFDLFAGPMYTEWAELIALEEPGPFDPVNDPDRAAFLRRMAADLGDSGDFSENRIEIADEEKKAVKTLISDAYRKFLEESGNESPVISLGNLRTAYILRMVKEKLEEKGYTDGYITTKDGFSVVLGEDQSVDYYLFTLKDGHQVQTDAFTGVGRSASVDFRAFALNTDSYRHYTVESGGKILYRHGYFSPLSGEPENVLMAFRLILPEGDPVDAACFGLNLLTAKTPEEAKAYVGLLEENGVIIRYNLQ